jgi:hypothetical protein
LEQLPRRVSRGGDQGLSPYWVDPRSSIIRYHHINESTIQKAVRNLGRTRQKDRHSSIIEDLRAATPGKQLFGLNPTFNS